MVLLRREAELSDDDDDPQATLTEEEQEWVRYQPWLERRGYLLRRRYRPGWEPSWIKYGMDPEVCEDSYDYTSLGLSLNDARKLDDGSTVILKKIPTKTPEMQITRYLRDLPHDWRNPAAPLVDIIPLPDTDEYVLLVLEQLVRYNFPLWETWGEILVCTKALLEGLAFMHQHGIAHMDIASPNLMMKPSKKFCPKGFFVGNHACTPPEGPDSILVKIGVRHTSRTVAPVKYHIIDYGESVRVSPLNPERIRGKVGHFLDVVDFRQPQGYDPFKLDVYALGETLHDDILIKRVGASFLEPVIMPMREKEPKNRPSIQHCVDLLMGIVNGSPLSQLGQIAHPSNRSPPLGFPKRLRVRARQAWLLNRHPMHSIEMEDRWLRDFPKKWFFMRFFISCWRKLVLADYWTVDI